MSIGSVLIHDLIPSVSAVGVKISPVTSLHVASSIVSAILPGPVGTILSAAAQALTPAPAAAPVLGAAVAPTGVTNPLASVAAGFAEDLVNAGENALINAIAALVSRELPELPASEVTVIVTAVRNYVIAPVLEAGEHLLAASVPAIAPVIADVEAETGAAPVQASTVPVVETAAPAAGAGEAAPVAAPESAPSEAVVAPDQGGTPA